MLLLRFANVNANRRCRWGESDFRAKDWFAREGNGAVVPFYDFQEPHLPAFGEEEGDQRAVELGQLVVGARAMLQLTLNDSDDAAREIEEEAVWLTPAITFSALLSEGDPRVRGVEVAKALCHHAMELEFILHSTKFGP